MVLLVLVLHPVGRRDDELGDNATFWTRPERETCHEAEPRTGLQEPPRQRLSLPQSPSRVPPRTLRTTPRPKNCSDPGDPERRGCSFETTPLISDAGNEAPYPGPWFRLNVPWFRLNGLLLDDLVAEVPGAAPLSDAGQTEGVTAGGQNAEPAVRRIQLLHHQLHADGTHLKNNQRRQQQQ